MNFFKIMLTTSRFWLLLTFLDHRTMVICCYKKKKEKKYIYMSTEKG